MNDFYSEVTLLILIHGPVRVFGLSGLINAENKSYQY